MLKGLPVVGFGRSEIISWIFTPFMLVGEYYKLSSINIEWQYHAIVSLPFYNVFLQFG